MDIPTKPPIIDRHTPPQNFDFIPSIEIPVSVTCFDRDGDIKSIKIDDDVITPESGSAWKKEGDVVTATTTKVMPQKDTDEIKEIKRKLNWKPQYDDIEYIIETAINWEKKLNACDFIYISHNHPDHLSRHTLKHVKKKQ